MAPIRASIGIVGAGPIGLELAAALKLANISYLQFDKGQVAQMIYDFPPQTPFFSSSERIGIAGIPVQTLDQQKCSREAYLAYIRSVVLHYQLHVNTYENVTSVSKLPEGGFSIKTSKDFYEVEYLVLATGGTSFSRTLGVPGEDGPNVSTRMGDPHQYFRKNVLIVGAKNSAVETALRCFHAGARVTLVTRAADFHPESVKYWLLPELQSRISKGEITCFPSTEVTEIYADRVVLNGLNGVMREMPTDFIIKAIGFVADMSLCKELGVPLSPENDSPAYDKETMETPVPGVFVLGTVIAGTQTRYRVFIENCHPHVEKITKTLGARLGAKIPVAYGSNYAAPIDSTTPLEE